MQVTFEVSEEIVAAFGSKGSFSTTALEALASEGYRSGHLSESQLMRLLGLPTRFSVHDWLRERRIPYQYSEADLSQDLESLSAAGLR